MKNISLLFVALFCFQNLVWTQEKPSKFRLELAIQSVSIKGSEIKIAQENEVFLAGQSFKYATQISGFWRLKDRLELGLGLAYTVRDANTTCYCIFLNCEKFAPADGVFTRIRSLDLPLELRWKWLKKAKRFDPYASFGLNTRMPFDFRSGPQNDQTRLNAKGTFIGASLGLGMRIHLYEKWSAILGLSAEKNHNFKFEKNEFTSKGSSIWLEEWSVKIGVGRSF